MKITNFVEIKDKKGTIIFKLLNVYTGRRRSDSREGKRSRADTAERLLDDRAGNE